jgi:hypothetical protein
MNKLISLALVFVLGLAVIGCKGKKGATRDSAQLALPKVIVDSTYKAGLNTITIDSSSISGNTLRLYVNYSGGCKKHDIDLIWTGIMAKSLPPQLPMALRHNNHGDVCRQVVSEFREFDLSPLKSNGYKTMVLNIQGHRVTYQPTP